MIEIVLEVVLAFFGEHFKFFLVDKLFKSQCPGFFDLSLQKSAGLPLKVVLVFFLFGVGEESL